MCQRYGKTKVVIGKPDLDSVGTLWLFMKLHNIDMNWIDLEVVRGQAEEKDLDDIRCLCIECGGSGRIKNMNFDHHGPEAKGLSSAIFQMAERLLVDFTEENKVISMIHYIDLLDREGGASVSRFSDSSDGPFLSDYFGGILLMERDQSQQVKMGIKLLNSFMSIPEKYAFEGLPELLEDPILKEYHKAHAENKRNLLEALANSTFYITDSGKRLAFLETQFFGAMGALYNYGANIVIALNPDMNGIRKFTIGGNDGVRVDSILPIILERETGWGGPASGTIIGSPQGVSSSLTLEEVVDIVITNL